MREPPTHDPARSGPTVAETRAEIQRAGTRVYESGRRRKRGQLVPMVLLLAILSTVLDLVLVILGYPLTFIKLRPVFIVLFMVGICHAIGFHLARKRVFAASFDFVLAGVYLIVWCAPMLVGESRLNYFVWLMPVEFVAITCAFAVAMLLSMETLVHRIQIATGIVFIVAFSIAICSLVGHWWPFVAVAVLGTNQALSPVWNRNRGRSANAAYPPWILRWFMFCVLYAVVRLWEMPKYGWAQAHLPLLEEQLRAIPLEGIQIYSTIAFGFFYFLWSGLYEITGRPQVALVAPVQRRL